MNNFEIVADNIRARRSTKPAILNGKIIAKKDIESLLELANWAPTHAMTEPWKFIVYTGESKTKFAQDQADLYKKNTPEEKFMEATYQKLQSNTANASHVIVAIMKRGNNPKIPVLEEICAAAAAVQNILLGAEALGIAALWSTGGLTLSPVLKEYFQLGEEDVIIGQLFLGYADREKEGTRLSSGEAKTTWHE